MANNLVDLAPVIQASALDGVQNRLAFLQDFTTDFSDEYVDTRKSTVKVPLLSGSSAIVNPTSFGGGNSGASLVTVTMQHIHVPFYISNSDYQNGYRLESLVKSNVQVMAQKLQELAFTPITTANFGAGITATTANFSLSTLQAMWKGIKGFGKVAYLGGDAFANLLSNQTTAIDPMLGTPYAGFAKVAYTDVITGLGTNIYGFAATKPALVMVSAKVEMGPKTRELIETVQIDLGNGLAADLNVWGSTSDRSENASIDLFFGCSAGDKTALTVVKSA